MLYIFLCIEFDNYKSIYSINDSYFKLYVKDYKVSDEYIKLTLCDDECLVGNYYYKNYDEVREIKYGSLLSINGSLSVPSNNTIPNSFNYKEYLEHKNIFYTINIDSLVIDNSNISVIDKVRNMIVNRINSIDKKGYIMAFIMGDKDYIDDEEYNSYQVIGVTHLFALSGMHVAIIVMFLNKIFGRFSEKLKIVLIDIILLFYGMLLFFPASLKRTIIFYLINSSFKLFGIELSSLKVLVITFALLVFSNYKLIYDIGFVYSFTTVGGILLSNEFIKSDHKLICSFKLSLVAFLFSLPISLYYFYSINILSIIYNVFYVFIISSFIYPLSIIVFLFPNLYFIYEFVINQLVSLTSFLSAFDIGIVYMSFNFYEVLIYFFFLILFIRFYKKVYLFLIGILLVADYIVPYFDNSAYIYCFDVGQGDSTLIISPYRKDIVMIDIGGVYGRHVSEGIVTFLKSQGIKKIDLFVGSHGDLDHVGDFKYFSEFIDIEKVKINKGDVNEIEKYMMDEFDNGSYTFNGMDVYFLDDGIVYDNENDNSIFSLFKIYDFTYLNSGDASKEQELSILDKYNFSNIDLFKVGHHGSNSSSDEEFIKTISPVYSIISVGKNNRYGHPNAGVLNTLNNSKIYRTDREGTIMFKIRNNKLQIETFVA